MNTQSTQSVLLLDRPGARLARRAAIVVALCALVATLTATWLSSTSALAGPGKPAPAARSGAKAPAPAPVVTAIDDGADDGDADRPKKAKRSKAKSELVGKLNLNTATVDQLSMLPGVGPSKAERVIEWRGKNGGFKRVADLRKVKGFGYKTLKKLEAYLDIKGDNTLKAK